MKSPNYVVTSFVATMLCLPFVGCGGGDRTSPTENEGAKPISMNSDTPEGCHLAFADAAEKKDYDRACSYVSKPSQDAMAGAMVVNGAMFKLMPPGMAPQMKADPKEIQAAASQIEKIMATHGFGDNPFDTVTKKTQKIMQQVMAAAMQTRGGETDNEAKAALGQPILESLIDLATPIEDKPVFIRKIMEAISPFAGGGPADPFAEMAGELKDVQIDGETAKGTLVKKNGSTEPLGFKRTSDGWKLHIGPESMVP